MSTPPKKKNADTYAEKKASLSIPTDTLEKKARCLYHSLMTEAPYPVNKHPM